jgi:hypothetical protein
MSERGQSKAIDERQGVLLLLLRGADSPGVDPIRIMKGAFIVTQEAPMEWVAPSARYEFVPEKYGPCSYDVYSDLDALVDEGLVQATQAPGRSWRYYSVTPAGQERAEDLRRRSSAGATDFITRVAQFVRGLPFAKLLKTIYARYPQYAVNSVFQY